MNKDVRNNSGEVQKLLAQLAHRKGIEPEYWDIWGHSHSISPETKLKILSAMGCRVESLEELKREVREGEFQDWKRIIDPVLIFSNNALPQELIFQIPVNYDLDRDHLPEDIQVQLEFKEEFDQPKMHCFSYDQLRFKESIQIEKGLYLRGSLPFPQRLPLGYHDGFLTVRLGEQCLKQAFKVIVCPEQTYLPPVQIGRASCRERVYSIV
jgi:4-alpha-glucanotransferase